MNPFRVVATLLAVVTLAAAAVATSSTRTASPPAAKSAATKPAAANADAGAKAKLLARGQQLTVVAGCVDCHTPGTMFGAPDFSRNLSGSELGWQGPWGTTYARNLTPDLETGLGYYKAEEIVKSIKGGHRLDGTPMLPPMPWQSYTAFDDSDLLAIATYLLSLPPVAHNVPDRVPPGQKATGSFLTFPAPSAWDVPQAAPDSSAKH
jgi:mono/diheme cytochrome c family protein